MSMFALIAQSRSRNPEFTIAKFAGDDVAGFEQGFNALDADSKSSLMQALIQARGSGGAINRAPVENWVGWNPQRAALAKQLEAAYAANPGAIEAMGKKYMMSGGLDAMRKSWGQSGAGAGWSGAMTSKHGLGTYLPLGAGLLGLIGGAATSNPWIAMLGLLAAGYGGYKLWNHAKTLQDPELMRVANQDVKPAAFSPQARAPGYANNPAAVAEEMTRAKDYGAAIQARDAARARIGEAADVVSPVSSWLTPFVGKGSAPVPKPQAPGPNVGAAPRVQAPKMSKLAWALSRADLPDRGDLAGSIKSHIDLYKMKKDIEQDRLLDPAAAGKMLAGIEYAERQIDAAHASVGTFGLSAAPLLGLAGGIALGSLFATSPATQAGLARIGDGVVSGAMRLGLL